MEKVDNVENDIRRAKITVKKNNGVCEALMLHTLNLKELFQLLLKTYTMESALKRSKRLFTNVWKK